MFPILFFCIFMGFPVAFCLMALAFFYGLNTFGWAIGHQILGTVFTVATSYEYAAIPLFVFMGVLLENSGLAGKLFEAINIWTGRIPGGLAIGSIIMCTIFAAASGIIGAVEVVVGIFAIPAMMKHHYNKGLIAGSICAGGALGTIIPPSIVAVIYAPMANISIGGLLIGIVIPGLLLAFSYIMYMLVRCIIRPHDGPRLSREEMARYSIREKMRITLDSLIPPMILIFAVMGSIVFGVAAPTEAAALGALGAVLLCVYNKKFDFKLLIKSTANTATVTTMIMFIIVGGNTFAGIFMAKGGGTLIETFIKTLDLSPMSMALIFLFIAFLAGFVLDCYSIMLVFVPIFAPLVAKAGIDPLWFAVLFMLIIQTSYITPPMAPSIFYLRGIAPPEITMTDMFKGIIPHVLCQWLVIGLVLLYPKLATWLPSIGLGFK
ncbi:MAG: TRAP transporter large permease subunit [Actinobacteria bacterium]|nr:TRAP transporter large permease subunit [Actinomycetota bacterium]